MTGVQAPNRLLDFADLERASWRQVLRQLDRMVARDECSYLHPSKRWEYPWALELAGLSPGSRVLDAGCGASIFPVFLAASGMTTIASDVQLPPRLDRQHHVFVEYIRGDLGALPLADSVFDAVFCISVIEHLEENGALMALQEVRRVLRPGGRLLLTTDYGEDAAAEIWYEGPGQRFRVDWHLFDEARLHRFLARATGWKLDGPLDLSVDWERMRPAMRRFHGYPYTSLGLSLVKA
ncbi:MAG: class I SAM-dependent methyltransferase [Desulfobacteraceae bacterium]|nr:class I SAM-dependent methyltransferase [Desulfobacteraceae bacterium]